MATNRYQNFANGVGLVPNVSTLNTSMGDLEVLQTGILNYNNGTTSSQVVTAEHSATLTNKSISLTTNTLTGTSLELATAISDETGSGSLVFATSPTLVTPELGTPSALVGTNITGTASGLTAGNVTTNANLTGPITSVGNATSIASQTGTGTTFVVDSSPTLITPVLGAATASSITGIAAGALTLNSPTGQNVVLQNNSTTTATVTSTGVTLASAKTFVLTNNSQTVTLGAHASASASYTITLPAAAPASNTALTYDGSNYVWALAASGFTVTTVTSANTPLTLALANTGVNYLVDMTSISAFTFNLPNPAVVGSGFNFTINDKLGLFSTFVFPSLVRFGSELIEGLASTYNMQAPWGSYTFFTDGTNWFKK